MSHTNCMHHMGCSSEDALGKLAEFHVSEVSHRNHLYNKSVKLFRLTKNYEFSAYGSSCNGTWWPVGHLLHFEASRLVV